MTIYRFNDSLIDAVAVRHSEGGGVRAYLHTNPGASPKTLQDLQEAITLNGMRWTPMEHEGLHTLEVRHIGGNGKKLLNFLQEQNAARGTPAKEVNPENQIKFIDKIKNNTLRLCGIFYSFADLSYMRYGYADSFRKDPATGNIKFSNPQNLLAGIFYALGSPVSSLFGQGDKSDIQERHISYGAMKHLEEKGFTIPPDAAIKSVTHRHNANLFRRIVAKCERYPAEITNSIFALAGSMIVWASVKDLQEVRTGHSSKKLSSIIMDIGLGSMTVLAGLMSVFIEEEKPNPNAPPKTGMARVWQWIKEKPLRAASGALAASTIFHAVSTTNSYLAASKTLKDPSSTAEQIAEARKEKQILPFRGAFVGGNLIAEGLMSVSSKGHGEGVKSDPSLEPSVYAIMADLILRSPQEKREHMLDIMSIYLADKDNLNIGKDEIQRGILAQMEAMQFNPWIKHQILQTAITNQENGQEQYMPLPAQKVPVKEWSKAVKSVPENAYVPTM